MFWQSVILVVTASTLGLTLATTTAAPMPGAEATLTEVWEWMSAVAKDTEEGAVNINMYMSGNKMSMTDTFFTMDVDKKKDVTSRMTGPMEDNDDAGMFSWAWSPSNKGGSINMYMYNNSMAMLNTVFTMAGEGDDMIGDGNSEKEINVEALDKKDNV